MTSGGGRPPSLLAAAAVVAGLVVAAGACGATAPARDATAPTKTATTPPSPAPSTSPAASLPPPTSAPTVPAPPAAPTTTTPPYAPPSPAVAPPPDGGPGTFGPTAGGALQGKVVAIDPGHNGGNFAAPSVINAPIFNGRSSEACDTTGTETDGGYTEATFNWLVAQGVAADLRAQGATVVLTRTSNTGVGPCVTQRAAIANTAHADAAVSIHADGGPAGGRGFAILEPVADGPNDAIIGASRTLGDDLRNSFLAGTGEPVSSYDGVDGIQARGDLGGTNLSTVPKVFIECANMRNAADAALVVSPAWQQQAAAAITVGLVAFLTGG